MSLLHQTFSAVKWTTGAKIAQQGLQFVIFTALMRLLGPAAFGLIGMVLVFSGFAAIFSEMGFGSALIQREKVDDAQSSTIFWFTFGIAAVLTAGFVFAAPLIAAFYKEPLLKPMTVWIALSFVLSAPAIVPRSLLMKSLRFDVVAKADIAAMAISGLVAAGVAISGGGVWSLVGQQLVCGGVTSVLLIWLGGWRPRPVWSKQALREMFGYGAGLTGFNIVNYWARSSDKMLIGNLLGSVALGLYSRAYSLMLMPLTQIVNVVTPVMFPAMSTIKDDKARIRRIFLRMVAVLTFVTFPMMAGLVVVAKPFVLGLFGAKWAEVVPLIQILSFVGMVQTLTNPVGLIYTSQGRTDWMFWWGIGGSAVLVLSIVAGTLLGNVQSVAWAYLIGNLVIAGPCIMIPGRLIGMSLGDVWQAIRGNLCCSFVMALAVWFLDRALPPGIPPLARLVITVPVGGIVYGGLAYFLRLGVLSQLREMRGRLATAQATA